MYFHFIVFLSIQSKVNSDSKGKTSRTFIVINQHLLELICYCAIKILHLLMQILALKKYAGQEIKN